jgi:hypothetical protein
LQLSPDGLPPFLGRYFLPEHCKKAGASIRRISIGDPSMDGTLVAVTYGYTGNTRRLHNVPLRQARPSGLGSKTLKNAPADGMGDILTPIVLSIPHREVNPMETRTKYQHPATRNVILSMVQKRPCTIRQITCAFNSRSYEVIKLLSDMVRNGQVMIKSTDNGLFVVGGHSNQ